MTNMGEVGETHKEIERLQVHEFKSMEYAQIPCYTQMVVVVVVVVVVVGGGGLRTGDQPLCVVYSTDYCSHNLL